jgi:hypothetical protein
MFYCYVSTIIIIIIIISNVYFSNVSFKIIFDLVGYMLCPFQRTCYTRCTSAWLTPVYHQSLHPSNWFIWLWDRPEDPHTRAGILFVSVSPLAGEKVRWKAGQLYAVCIISLSPCLWTVKHCKVFVLLYMCDVCHIPVCHSLQVLAVKQLFCIYAAFLHIHCELYVLLYPYWSWNSV